jgi:hypothetical protein
MRLFETVKFYLKDFYETILAYAKARLLFVGGEDSFSENSCLLIQKLIKCSLEYNYY